MLPPMLPTIVTKQPSSMTSTKSPRSNLTPLSSCMTQTPGRQADFALAISHCFDALSLPDRDVQVLYSGIVSTVQNAAKEVVRKPPKRSTHYGVSARLEDLVHQCNAAKHRYPQKCTAHSRQRWWRSVKRSAKPMRRTTVIILPERSRNLD